VVSRPIFQRDWLTDPDDDYSPASVPVGYQLQTLTETMLAEAAYGQSAHAVVAALVHDTFTVDLHLIDVPRHPDAEAKILARTGAFWADMDAGRQPVVDPEQDQETVKALWPRDNGAEIDLSGDNLLPALVDQRTALGAQIKDAEAVRERIGTEIRGKMREASYARLADGRRLSLLTTNRKGFSVGPTTFRTLRIAKG
jgi:hypothetical protein